MYSVQKSRSQSVFLGGRGPRCHDICRVMGEAAMMSHGNLLLCCEPMRGVEGKGSTVRCAAVRQKTEAWQESCKVFQSLC